MYVVNRLKTFVGDSLEMMQSLSAPQKLMHLCLVGLFVMAVLHLVLHSIVALISITLISIFINKLINIEHFKLSPISKDFSGPLISIPVFALSTLIYMIIPEVAIVLSVLVIPFLINDINSKFKLYDEQLTPIEA